MGQNGSICQLECPKYRNTQVLHVLPLVISGVLLLFLFNTNVYDVFARDQNNVTIKTTKLTDSLYMLEGLGDNILLSIGQNGAFMVDDQFVLITVKIKDAISKLTVKPINFVINTHWHGDHT
jgi:cyclase